ncbi:MAG: hypothetical protein FWH23_01145 [Bacteroidales bacterium]|nr:hypothetical protein [Bacteroidales bacterium]MCL2133221.1 hypothetical protein [Bacteroidales bacterium]
MKTVVKNILLVLLVSLYSVTVIGVGIYNCHCSHSGQIVLLADDACSCQEKHQCCQDHEQETTTEEHCCDIKYKILQIDQVVSSKVFTFNNFSIDKALFFPVMLIKLPAPFVLACHDYDPPPLEDLPSPDIYRLAQLRL